MRLRAAGIILVSSCLMLGTSGCAKHELVKKDEGLAPATASTAKPPVKTTVATPPIKTEVVSEKPVKKEPTAMKDNAMPASSRSSQLQAALQKIYFDFDSFKLSDSARDTLVKNAEFIKKDSADQIRIEGNCDERGSDEYNLALGEKRAKVAVDYLVTLGLPSERLSVISYGKEKPIDPGHTEDGWAKNRRDEFAVIAK